MLKKFLSLIISIIFSFSSLFLFSCKKEDNVINIYVVDGLPLLSVCSLLKNNEVYGKHDKYEIKINIVNGVDAIKGAISRKEADLAVCPINLSATLYNGGLNYRLLTVNVLGELTLIGKPMANFPHSYKGKTIYNTGMGGTPDVAFKALLKKYGVNYTENLSTAEEDKINMKYLPSTADVVSLLNSGVAEYAILAQPFASYVLNDENHSHDFAESISERWYYSFDTNMMQAGLIVSEDMLYKDFEAVRTVVSMLGFNYKYYNDNYKQLPTILAENGSSLTFNYENIDYIDLGLTLLNAKLNKTDIEKYLNVLLENSPSSVGGKLPNDDFYLDYEDLVRFQK